MKLYYMANIVKILFGESKKEPLEEKHEHTEEVKRLMEETKHITSTIAMPKSISEV
jgi:hypothetical protein